MVRWQIQEAKNRLSELVRKARTEGPQMITLHGRDAVVVLAAASSRAWRRSAAVLRSFCASLRSPASI